MSKKKESIMSIALLVVGLIWGGGFIAVKSALNAGLSPLATNMTRFLIAALCTFIAFRKEIVTITKEELKIGLIPSVMMSLGFLLQSTGLQFTTPGNSGLITGFYIILVPIFVAIATRTRLKFKIIISAILTFVGITVLSLPSFNAGAFNFGDVLTFLCAVFFALHFLTLDKALIKVSAFKMTFIQMLFAGVMFGIAFLIFDLKTIENINFAKGILPLVYLGLLSSFVAYLMQTYAQKFINPTKVAIILSSECIFAPILSVAMGLEGLTIYLVVGGALAISGIVLAQIPSKEEKEA